MHSELTNITLLTPTLLQLSSCLDTPNASTLAGPVRSIDALAPVAIIKTLTFLRALSSAFLSFNEILNVSASLKFSGIIESFLTI